MHNSIYIFTYKTGIQTIVSDSLQLIPGGEFFAYKNFSLCIPFSHNDDDSAKLFLTGSTNTKKLYTYDGEKFEEFPIGEEAADFIWNNSLYDFNLLSDNTFAAATLRNGIGIIDRQGRLIRNINMNSGLRSQFVLRLFQDREKALWLALGDGLARIEYPAPISVYGEELDFDVTPTSITRHQGSIYVSGQTSIYRLNTSDTISAFPSFTTIPGIEKQTFQMISVDSSLLIANQSGLYEWIEGKSINRLIDTKDSKGAIFSLCHSKADPSIVYVGTDSSLILLKKLEKEWVISEPIKGIGSEVRFIAEGVDREVWVASFSNFCARVTFSDSAFSATSPFKFNLTGTQTQIYRNERGMPAGGIKLPVIDGQVMFNTEKGMMQFNAAKDTFEMAYTLGTILTDSTLNLNEVYQDLQGNIWIFSHKNLEIREVRKLVKQSDGSYEYAPIPPIRTFAIGNIPYRIYDDPMEKEVMWIGANNGMLRFDGRVGDGYTTPYTTLIRRITAKRDSTIFAGKMSNTWELPRLDYSLNELRFEFSAPYMEKAEETVYQYYLEGFDKSWSAWTNETQKDYTNLSEGKYTFRMKAKNVYGHISEEGGFAFNISPPWYRSLWAYLCYIIAGISVIIGGIYFYSKWRLKKLEAYNRELEQKVEEQTQKIINAQDQLIMQEKMASLGQMTTGLAHEIKNPLNFVNNFAKITAELSQELKEELETFAEIKDEKGVKIIHEILDDMSQNLEDIKESGKRADNIINSMMMHAVEGVHQQRETDINELILTNLKVVWDNYQERAGDLSIIIEKDFENSLPSIQSSPQKLGLAFKNLLDNAYYALIDKLQTHGGDNYTPTLAISSREKEGKVVIKIRDNGSGIPEEVQERIFTPFFSTKPTGKGNTGMGLPITYDIIVNGHNGSLEVQSEINHFTEFTVTL